MKKIARWLDDANLRSTHVFTKIGQPSILVKFTYNKG